MTLRWASNVINQTLQEFVLENPPTYVEEARKELENDLHFEPERKFDLEASIAKVERLVESMQAQVKLEWENRQMGKPEVQKAGGMPGDKKEKETLPHADDESEVEIYQDEEENGEDAVQPESVTDDIEKTHDVGPEQEQNSESESEFPEDQRKYQHDLKRFGAYGDATRF